VEPGEIVVLESGEPPRSVRFSPPNPALCVFELIYFARPDSYLEGVNLYEARRRMGMQLAAEQPTAADLVMPVPDTGAPAAAGYAEASGIPYREGMVRNRYAGRTFIQPSQGLRQRGVTVKLSPIREVVRGKRLVVVDDSIVRGTTTRAIVSLLRKAGAAEVHVRISAPPIYHPCFYGIDTSIERKLMPPPSVRRSGLRRAIPSGTSPSAGCSARSSCPTGTSASPASTVATPIPSPTKPTAASSCSKRSPSRPMADVACRPSPHDGRSRE
jgi:amidophosphoribosyltransferase